MRLAFILSALLLQTSLFASWYRYPSISPDGKQIAFAAYGDVWVVSSEGGQARQITSNSAYDFMPVWSPDGKQIAFASNRNGNYDVFLVSAEGGEPLRLTYHSSSDFPYTFSPDGKEVWYGSARLDDHKNAMFPSRVLHEIYSVSINGGREKMNFSAPAEALQFSPNGKMILMHDRKGYEDQWRKHHTSSVTRDIVLYDVAAKSFKKVATWKGEDRNPVWINDSEYYFLSEKSGSFNIWKGSINGESHQLQITKHEKHPVRFLSSSKDGVLCYSFDGEIYLFKNNTSQKVNIIVKADVQQNELIPMSAGNGFSEFALSPNGKEVALIYRGDVFVSSVNHSTTKRITNTPGQERSVSFSPDGKKLLYAAERGSSWDLFEASLSNADEKYFYNSTLITEKCLSNKAEEEFQPKYSPDGKKVAYLEERTTVKVLDLASGKSVTAMEGSYNYSYSDGDQNFVWAPDSKWLLVEFFENERWSSNIGLVSADGGKKPVNISRSGYGNGNPKFMMDGEMIAWTTDKYGFRSHGSWGSQTDVEAIFLTKEAWKKFSATKMEKEYEEEIQKEKDKGKGKEEAKDKNAKDSKKEEEKKEEVKALKIDEDGLQDRRVRLTIHSSFLSDYLITKDASQMFYLCQFDKGFDLWTTKFKDSETKLLAKMGSSPSGLEFDKEEKNIYLMKNGVLVKIDVSSGSVSPISVDGQYEWKPNEERAYMFEHAWRQLKKKFYVADLHGVDWDFYKKEYGKHVAEIRTGQDFAELLSEMLGEVNASHTGASFRSMNPNGDQTASLGCYYDQSYSGKGYKIAELMPKSPLLQSGKINAGTLITAIDGVSIDENTNIYSLLNRKAGKTVLVEFKKDATVWTETIKPISQWEESDLAYLRFIQNCEKRVDQLSGGKVGYVHVEGMNSESFREVFDKALGNLNTKSALIVDTRFNGGGWLHDDLATLLSGKRYMNFEPRGQKNMGGEPLNKWQKPSCVLMSEGNYSDAHLFPYTYRALEIGKLIGMPVPGTGTAVWWETMIDYSTVFGIPQVGMRSIKDGYLVENHDLVPDIQVENDWNTVLKGQDLQLEAAVKEMLK